MEPFVSLLLRCWLVLINFIIDFKITHSLEDKKGLMYGMNLRVSAFEYPPFMMSNRGIRGNVTYSGAGVDSLEIVADYFRLKLTYVPLDPAEVEKHGVGMALVHQLKNDKVDYAPFPFVQILEYSRHIDFCFPMIVDNYILMQPFPKEQSRLSAPIKPFSNEVWILVFVSMIAFIIMTAIVIYTRNRSSGPQPTIFEQLYRRFEYVIKIITSQGNNTPREFNRFLLRLMIALWLLSMVVLINAYIGTFTARLAVTKLEPTVDTLEDLAASKSLKMTVELNSDIGYKALEAESGPYKAFGDNFRKHPELLFTQPLDSIPNVAEHSCAYPGSANLINFLINADFKGHGECRMTTASKFLPYFIPFSTAFQKGSPYTKNFNEKLLLRSWENGLLERMRQKTFPPIPRKCQPWGAQRMGNTAFKLNDFIGVFAIFIGGCVVAVFVFIVEWVFYQLLH